MKKTGQIKPEDKENFMNQESQTPHKRRVRYKGKYPKKFEEKYKELQPEKYKDTIEHVISKGNTPAGMHISIMVKEIIDFLEIRPGQVGFDATLGYGGHTKAMLECLRGQGHMYATDVDPEESAKTRKRLAEQGFGEDILTIKLQNFCTIDEIAEEVGGFDFILADLGVSSMQIDNPKRGFSFKVDGPLDLRLNQETGISAAQRLDTISREELAGMLDENSDEPYCEEAEFIIATDNNGSYSVGNEQYHLDTGDLLLIWPGEMHSNISVTSNSSLLLQFGDNFIYNCHDLMINYRHFKTYHKIGREDMTELNEILTYHMKEAYHIFKSHDPFTETACTIQIYSMLMALGKYIYNNINTSQITSNCSSQNYIKIQNACTYISQNCEKDLSQKGYIRYFWI